MINRRSQLPSNNVGLLESWTSKAALVVKDPHADAGHTGDADPVLGSGRSPGGGHDNPFTYSCLENLMDRGDRQATVHGVAKSQTRQET